MLNEWSIGFCDLCITCSIGVLPHEEKEPQEILLSLEVGIDPSKCLENGQLCSTIDYSAMASLCEKIAKEKHYSLLETLADKMLTEIEASFEILSAKLRIEKKAALTNARCAFVQVERSFKRFP